MFDRIAPRYDLLNRVLSMRQDVYWRRRLARLLPDRPELALLDLATGTGDVLIELTRRTPRITTAVGMDMAGQMLRIGQQKLAARPPEAHTAMVRADATCIAAADAQFDAVTIAFGIRNVLDVKAGLREMHRVLKPGGRALILEFSLPQNRLLRSLYLLYFRHVLPRIGGALSGDEPAYRYLNQTVESFPYGEAFCGLMRAAGFVAVRVTPLTFGIASIYTGDRP